MNILPEIETKKTDLHIVVIDETKHWATEVKKEAGKLLAVYLFDKNQITYACEITPSYTLIPLGTRTEKCVSEKMDEIIRENDVLETRYVHCSQIEKLKTEKAINRDFEYYDDEEYNDELESVIDYLMGSPPIC